MSHRTASTIAVNNALWNNIRAYVDCFICRVQVRTKVMLDAIGQIIEDPSFKIPTAEAMEEQDAALNLSAWQKDPKNQEAFEIFSSGVCGDFKGAFEGPAGRTPSANRERVWKRLFSIWSSERLTARWVGGKSAKVTTTPVLF